MGFSAFSKPLGYGRLASYIGGGAAVGAGTGAMMSGRDSRTSGAVVGAGIGIGVGAGVTAAHAFSGMLGGSAEDARFLLDRTREAAWAQKTWRGTGRVGKIGLAMAGKAAMRNVNVESNVLHGYGRAVSAVSGIMSRFRR